MYPDRPPLLVRCKPMPDGREMFHRRQRIKSIAHAPFEGVKMGRCLGLYFFGCGDIANMSQPSGDTAA
jgi:hypothetical protein